MKDLTEKNFGIIIAFLLPGFLFLWGLSFSSDAVAIWIEVSGEKEAPMIAGFLYTTLASLALGLLISALRWLIVDHILWLLGVVDPGINFGNLKDKDRYAAFIGAVENHYRYYQYYSNTLVAIIAAFVIYLFAAPERPSCSLSGGIFLIVLTLFLASRDALNKFYQRSKAILNNGY